MDILRDLVEWTAGWANTRYGDIALFLIAFAESSFFPVPPDVLLIPLALSNTAKALIFAAIATIGSLSGGAFGFFIGDKGGRPLVHRLFNEKKIAMVQSYYRRYDVWAVGIAGFTPIPYKLFSISAGAFGLDFKRFMVASLIGRAGRFFLVGLFITLFGAQVAAFLDQYFDLAVVAFTVLLIGGFVAVNVLAKRSSREPVPAPSKECVEPPAYASRPSSIGPEADAG